MKDVLEEIKEPRLKAYLAGPMEYAENAGLGWRLQYRDLLTPLGIDVVIPELEEDKITNQARLNYLKKHNLDEYINDMRKLIDLDLNFVQTLDLVICRWEGERMSGTIGEFQKAYEVGKKTILVTSLPFEEVPGWFLACSTDRFHTTNELIDHLRRFYQ